MAPTFELNDHRGTIVGSPGSPCERAERRADALYHYSARDQYLRRRRFTISYVLVQTEERPAVAGLKQASRSKLGYVAFTRMNSTNEYPTLHLQDRIGTNILLMTVISFIVDGPSRARPFIPSSSKPGEIRRA